MCLHDATVSLSVRCQTLIVVAMDWLKVATSCSCSLLFVLSACALAIANSSWRRWYSCRVSLYILKTGEGRRKNGVGEKVENREEKKKREGREQGERKQENSVIN